MKKIALIIIMLAVGYGVYAFVNEAWPFTKAQNPEILGGTIEGSLGYPSSGIPKEMQVCAERVSTSSEYCTAEHIAHERFDYGEGYSISVPAGDYYVYAFLDNNGTRVKAYYSQFVTCGLHVGCTSHEPIIVKVSAGQLVTDIDPQDWYAPK